MASGQVLDKLRSHYAKADAEINRWNAAQVHKNIRNATQNLVALSLAIFFFHGFVN